MSRFRARLVHFLLIGLLGLMFLPGGALAAKPAFHDQINETIEGADICGVIGTLQVRGVQVITLGDTTFSAKGQVTQVFTTADGRNAVIKLAGTYTNTFTDNGDGTITIADIYKGLPEKISTHGQGGVELRDAGVISFIATIDLNTGDVTFEVVQHGPHPEADSDFTLFCDAFLAALG